MLSLPLCMLTKLNFLRCWFLLILGSLCALGQTEAKTFYIPNQVDWVRQIDTLPIGAAQIVFNALYLHAAPGDTIAILAGTRAPIKFEQIKGSQSHPLVICNAKGIVTITKPVDGFYGLSFSGAKHIKLMGIGSRKSEYGICVAHLPKGSAISFGDFSEGIEICGVSIEDIASSGITIKTDPNCYQLEQFKNFHLQGIYIHHNRIAKVGNEGIYIGNSFYHEGNGMLLNCPQQGGQVKLLPHPITGVNISYNLIDSTGWDGIQVSAAQEVDIRYNTLSYCAYARHGGQMSGIFIGEPSKVLVASNFINQCYGNAIECFGLSAIIEHNLISYPQLWGQTYAIYLNDKVHAHSELPLLTYQVRENTLFLGVPQPSSGTGERVPRPSSGTGERVPRPSSGTGERVPRPSSGTGERERVLESGAIHAGHMLFKHNNVVTDNLIFYIPKIGYGTFHYLHGNQRSHFYNNLMYPVKKLKPLKRMMRKAARKFRQQFD
jgi:hypothetical protein